MGVVCSGIVVNTLPHVLNTQQFHLSITQVKMGPCHSMLSGIKRGFVIVPQNLLETCIWTTFPKLMLNNRFFYVLLFPICLHLGPSIQLIAQIIEHNLCPIHLKSNILVTSPFGSSTYLLWQTHNESTTIYLLMTYIILLLPK